MAVLTYERTRLVLAGLLALSAAGAPADDPHPAPGVVAPAAFRAARKDFQQKIKNREPVVRIEAIEKLKDVAGRDAAELLWQTVLDDSALEVRSAAVALLIEWREKPEVSHALYEELTRATRRSGMSLRTAELLRSLAGTRDESLQSRVLAYLDEYLGTPQCNQHVIHALADELGYQGDAESLRALILFSRAKFFTRHFGYRRCVLQGVVHVQGDEAISFLIDQLPNLRGLVQYDVIVHLSGVTGENFKDDAVGWKTWWLAHRQTFKPKKVDESAMSSYSPSRVYYGIPIGAKKIVFTIDVSGSMAGAKIEAARRELVEAIQGLAEDVSFSVVAFSGTVSAWSYDLRQADAKNKEYAIQYVLSQSLGNGTASYDALEASFALDPEAIYFVSDGAPVGGKITNPDEIVATVSTANRVRRVSVHTIGIGTASQPAFGRFMRNLAHPNWGEFREPVR